MNNYVPLASNTAPNALNVSTNMYVYQKVLIAQTFANTARADGRPYWIFLRYTKP